MKPILGIVSVAVVSYFVWNHFFSRSAQIERAYTACVSKFDAGVKTADIHVQTSDGGDPAGALAKGMGDAMTSLVQGMNGAMSSATCGLIKQTCAQDFDGPLCQAARNSSR